MDTKNLGTLYDLPAMEWSGITQRLEAGFDQSPGAGGPDRHSTWLSTVNEDGSPHVTGIGAFWIDGSFWFVTAASSRKGRNVARDQRCAMSLSVHEFDLVVEGTAALVTDPETVAKVAAVGAAGGWPCEVDETGTALTAPFSAPSAGPPPWHVYRITTTSATALGTVEPGGATRWTF